MNASVQQTDVNFHSSMGPGLPFRRLIDYFVRPATAAVLMTLCAFALRLVFLPDRSVWWDEAFSAWMARKSAVDIILYQAGEVHPPFYYLVLHWWSALVGDGEYALRLLSAAFGALTVALIYRIGSRFSSPAVGLIAASCLTVSRFHIWWSQEIRMYSLATLLAVVSLYFFLRFMEEQRPYAAVAYGVATLLLLLTLYIGILTILAQNLVMLIWLCRGTASRQVKIGRLLRWACLEFSVAVLYVPWLYLLSQHAGVRAPVEAPLAPGLFAQVYATVITVGMDTNIQDYSWVVWAIAAFVVCSLVFLWRLGRFQRLQGVGVAYVLVPPGILYVMSALPFAFFTPETQARYFLLFVPAWFLLAATIVWQWGQRVRWLLVVLVGILVFVSGWNTPSYFSERFKQDDYQSLTATIRAYAQSDDVIVLNPDSDWPIFQYHMRDDLPLVGLPNGQKMTEDTITSWLQPAWSKYQRVWLVSTVKALAYDPENNVEGWLQTRGEKRAEWDYGQTRLTLYVQNTDEQGGVWPRSSAQPEKTVSVDLPSGISLEGFDVGLDRVQTGQVVHLALWWGTSGNIDMDYGVRLSLVSDKGDLVGTRTWSSLATNAFVETLSQGNRCRGDYVFPVTRDIESGTYTWQIELMSTDGKSVGTARLGRLTVVQTSGAEAVAESSDVPHQVNAQFGDCVELVGYNIEGSSTVSNEIRPGDTITVKVWWRALQPMSKSYSVFVHLLGTEMNQVRKNHIWGARDTIPQNGNLPTTTWATGELVVDSYVLTLDGDSPPGPYQVEIGLYEHTSGHRLTLATDGSGVSGDSVVLTSLNVVP